MQTTAVNLKKSTSLWDRFAPFIISVSIALGVGTLSALITLKNMSLYEEIISPPLAPPAILFPIVWSILYTLMGISAAMIFNRRKKFSKESQDALFTYSGSLIINFAWSIIFFNMRAFLLSLAWLVLLLAFIIKTILQYKKLYPLAAYLQIPYLLWVIFAGYLNLAIYILN